MCRMTDNLGLPPTYSFFVERNVSMIVCKLPSYVYMILRDQRRCVKKLAQRKILCASC